MSRKQDLYQEIIHLREQVDDHESAIDLLKREIHDKYQEIDAITEAEK